MPSVSDLTKLCSSTVPSVEDALSGQDIIDSSRTSLGELWMAHESSLAISDRPLGVGVAREMAALELLVTGVARDVIVKGTLDVGVVIEVKAVEHWSVIEGTQNVLGEDSWSF